MDPIEMYDNRPGRRKEEFLMWLRRMTTPIRRIKYGHQRIKRGYCDEDVWNIDYWFYRVAVPMIDQHRRTKHGIPNCIADKYRDAEGNLDEEAALAEHDRILRRMIWLFRESDPETSKGGKYKGEAYMDKCKDMAFSMFSEWFHSLWD